MWGKLPSSCLYILIISWQPAGWRSVRSLYNCMSYSLIFNPNTPKLSLPFAIPAFFSWFKLLNKRKHHFLISSSFNHAEMYKMSHLGNHLFLIPVNNMWNGTFLHNSWMNRFVMIRCEKTIQQNDTLTIHHCSFLQWVLGTALHKRPLLKKQRVRRVQSLYWALFTVNGKGLVFSEVCSDSFWVQAFFLKS